MFSFTVRTAEIKDAEGIFNYNVKHGRSAISLEETKSALEEILSDGTSKVFIAINSQHIAGYIYAREIISLTEPRYIEIVNFVLSDFFREKGVGTVLVQAIRQWAEQMLASKIIFSAKIYDLEKYTALEEDNYIKDERSLIFFRTM